MARRGDSGGGRERDPAGRVGAHLALTRFGPLTSGLGECSEVTPEDETYDVLGQFVASRFDAKIVAWSCRRR